MSDTHQPSSSRLISFHLGKGPDHKRRWIDEIWDWDYDQVEETHDYIQWLFPLKQKSGFNPTAPTLTDDVIQAFRDSSENTRWSTIFIRCGELKVHSITVWKHPSGLGPGGTAEISPGIHSWERIEAHRLSAGGTDEALLLDTSPSDHKGHIHTVSSRLGQDPPA